MNKNSAVILPTARVLHDKVGYHADLKKTPFNSHPVAREGVGVAEVTETGPRRPWNQVSTESNRTYLNRKELQL